MIWLPIVLVPLFMFLVAYIRSSFEKKTHVRLCAICSAVVMMWVLFLFANGSISLLKVPIAILMGMSVTGFMYFLEGYFKKNHIKNFWFARLVVILGGFYSIWFLLEGKWGMVVLILLFCTVLVNLLKLTKKEALIMQNCCD